MDSLYVCHFSNGHIKVGRSIDPMARIASHADRVGCLGIELVEHFIAPCTRSAVRERLLINRCADASTQRNRSEWFVGLDYPDVCAWASECAAVYIDPVLGDPRVAKANTGIDAAVKAAGGLAKLAAALGETAQAVSNWRARGVPANRCKAIEAATGVSVQFLRPNDWHDYWPDADHAVAPAQAA
jgi:DNA-binding transcriptional regulator YdaS (Cro superfamily)